MTKTEKKKFIKDLCNSARDAVVAKVEQMPSDWDGHEMRQLLADRFESDARGGMSRARLNAYKHAVLSRYLDL